MLLEGMGWQRFEDLAAEGFRQRGYTVTELGGHGARAVDMVLTRGTEVHLVDGKCWRAQAVGAAPLRGLAAAMQARGAAGGFVLTSGVFTPQARRLGEVLGIQLIDGATLRELIHAHAEKTQPAVHRRLPGGNAPPPPTGHPHHHPCHLCSGAMEEPLISSGLHAGERLLSCVHHPLCDGTRRL